jgi:transcription elongation factor Elf1
VYIPGDLTPYHCDKCEMKLASRDRWRRHRQHHHSEGAAYTCPTCGRCFTTEEGVVVHVKRYHPENKKLEFKCSFCELPFNSEGELAEHEGEHRKRDVPFSCLICGENTTSSTDLIRHMQIHDEKKLICDVCGLRFATSRNLKTHKNIHDETFTKHQCGECGLRCLSKGVLSRHLARHSDVRSHVCDKCGKAYKYSSALKVHLRGHDKVYPFKCKICGKGFAASHFMKKHEQIHSGILAYQCKYCSKRFKAQPNLFQHTRIHCPNAPNKFVYRKPPRKPRNHLVDDTHYYSASDVSGMVPISSSSGLGGGGGEANNIINADQERIEQPTVAASAEGRRPKRASRPQQKKKRWLEETSSEEEEVDPIQFDDSDDGGQVERAGFAGSIETHHHQQQASSRQEYLNMPNIVPLMQHLGGGPGPYS